MNKIFDAGYIKNLPKRDLKNTIKDFLDCGHTLSMSMAAIEVGLKMASDYSKLSHLLLDEIGKDVHFQAVRLGVPSAWTIAVVLAENLKPEDYPKLQEAYSKWGKEEKEGLIHWLADFPEQRKILEEGKL